MRYAKRTDANHETLVRALRLCLGKEGTVLDLSGAGRGTPDIMVGTVLPDGIARNFLFEIKDGAKCPSRKRLTPPQERFHGAWMGHVDVVESAAEAMAVIHARPIWEDEQRMEVTTKNTKKHENI